MNKTKKKSLWTWIPSAALALILSVGGIIQFSEQVSAYFPVVSEFIVKNSTAILFIIAILLSIFVFVILKRNQQLSQELQAIDYNESRRKIILFLTPSPLGQFYLQHLSNLFIKAAHNADADMQIYIVMLSPAQAFQKDFCPELSFNLVDNFPAKVSGVFMLPSDPDIPKNMEGIKSFSEKVPTVLLDVYPGKDLVPEFPPFVGSDENMGGRLAAIIAKQWLDMNWKLEGKILILIGRNTEWEMQRANSFKEKLKLDFPKIDIFESEDLNYQREPAKKLIERLSVNNYALGPENHLEFSKLDIIYACNDEMAIGALEAIQSFTKKNPDCHSPKIIGYDGVPKMVWLIKHGNPHILGTINVKVEKQAEQALSVMTLLLKNKSLETCLKLISPESVLNYSILMEKNEKHY